jgi:superfamily I DNA and RNA helicase
MAIMIPNRITAEMRATSGEAKTFNAIAKGLSNDWYVWYDVGIGNKEVYPDFILIHPLHGIVVLEVKDILFKNFKSISKTIFSTGTYSFPNPIIQARNYVFNVINDKKLTEKVPYHYAVVFANINTDMLNNKIDNVSILDLIDHNLIITKNDLSNERILIKIESIVKNTKKQKNITLKTFNTLRMIIDPSVKVPHRYQLRANENLPEPLPAVLDLKQERASKSIGEGHRLIKGIAGSGKTLILLYRAKLLAKMHPEWNVLFICWNRTLINYLRQMYDGINIDVNRDKVQFTYFSRWMSDIARVHHIPMPKITESYNYDLEFKEVAQVLTSKISTDKYQAIMIDEAQDFEEDYFRLLLNHLDQKTNSLLICYDYAQNLYKKVSSWKSLGISVSGRRSINLSNSKDALETNYRNTLEITRFAKFIYNDNIPTKDELDNIGYLSKIAGATNRGPLPTVQLYQDREREYKTTIDWIKKTKKENQLSFHDFIIIYPGKQVNSFDLQHGYFNHLEKSNIPFTWITRDQDSKSNFTLHDGTLKISTIHSAKGMDFDAVVMVACDCVKSESPEAELYTSATRARKFLLVTTGGNNHKVNKILDFAYQSSVDWLENLSK